MTRQINKKEFKKLFLSAKDPLLRQLSLKLLELKPSSWQREKGHGRMEDSYLTELARFNVALRKYDNSEPSYIIAVSERHKGEDIASFNAHFVSGDGLYGPELIPCVYATVSRSVDDYLENERQKAEKLRIKKLK